MDILEARNMFENLQIEYANHMGLKEKLWAIKTQSSPVKEHIIRTLQAQGSSEELDSASERTAVRISWERCIFASTDKSISWAFAPLIA